MTQQESAFLQQLQAKAKEQAKLEQNKLLPEWLDSTTALIGNYPWQILLTSSFISAVVVWMLL